jgi:hypothetical protein
LIRTGSQHESEQEASNYIRLDTLPEQMELSPLRQMADEERLVADFHGSGTTQSSQSLPDLCLIHSTETILLDP